MVVRALVAIFGLGLTGAGIAAVFTTTAGAGSAALVGAGSLLVVLGALGAQIESLRYGNLELILRRKADEAKLRGDPKSAEILEQAADTVSGRMTKTARSYESIRGGMASSHERTKELDKIVEEARADAHNSNFDQQYVFTQLWTGSEGERVWALAVLQERPELATTGAVLEAVQRPDQKCDEHHALVLAKNFVELPTTSQWARERVVKAVESLVDAGVLGKDTVRLEVAKDILAKDSSVERGPLSSQ